MIAKIPYLWTYDDISSDKQKKHQNQINFHKSRYDNNCNAKIQIKFWKIYKKSEKIF